MTTDGHNLAAVLRRAVSVMTDAGVDDAAADGRILAASAFGLSREDMLRDPDRTLDAGKVSVFRNMIARRAAREPVSRILGKREFRSLDFEIGPATLDPRPDSETVVEAALDAAADMAADLRVLDIGTGSGCLLLSVLHALPAARGTGTDIDADAVAGAERNASALGLSGRAGFLRTSWTDGLEGPFDIVLSNPPYIPSADISGLAPEVAGYDPVAALDGGADGLDAYRALSACIGRVLSPSGCAVLEIGVGQAADAAAIFGAAGYRPAAKRNDLAGHTRALAFRPAAPRHG